MFLDPFTNFDNLPRMAPGICSFPCSPDSEMEPACRLLSGNSKCEAAQEDSAAQPLKRLVRTGMERSACLGEELKAG